MVQIDYIEFWATKHCNLNCRGCSSCSPISEEWFLEADKLIMDLNRFIELGIEFSNINILGGEPLLHPEITTLFDVVKNIYPDCNLGILTNGLLLKHMNSCFWSKCKEHNVVIKVTCFPIFSEDEISSIEQMINRYGIEYKITRKKKFNKILMEDNPSKIDEIIKACGCNHAYNLYDGFISRCTVPMITELFNSYFDTSLNTTGRLNIYESSADEIIQFLSLPNASCINCSAYPQKVNWEKAKLIPNKNDWLISPGE